MRRQIVSALTVLMCVSAAHAQAPNTLTAAEKSAGWKLLFDGKTTTGWRNYMKPGISDGWKVVDGVLTRVAQAGDIVTKDKYKNFELSLEWRLDPNSPQPANSGIFFHAIEGPSEIYESAPEMQILDDTKHPDGKLEITSAGSNFALHPVPRGVVKPVGQWNSVRLVVKGPHVEHWLNRRKVVEYELWSPDWNARVEKSKFKAWPEYGKAKEGFIGLQDHGTFVSFRNIKIKVLPN